MQKKILVVDNNKVILRLLTNLLESKGYMVQTAESGLLALGVLKSYQPDVIFIDLVMPNIDGQNLCRILRGKPEYSSTVLVILSAVAVEAELDFAGFGADACIAKGPVNEMGKYIELIMDCVAKKTIHILPKEVLGSEHVYAREITSELLGTIQGFEATLENMDNGFLELTKSGRIVYCNTLAARFLNTTAKQLLATKLFDHFPQKRYAMLLACLQKVQLSLLPITGESSIQLEDRELVTKFIPVRKKEEMTVILLLEDVTKEKTAEKKLQQYLKNLEKAVAQRTEQYEETNRELQEKISERLKINEELEFVARQWSNTFDTITDFVSVHDKDMKFVRVNKALMSFLGKDPEKVLGKHCHKLMHDCDSPHPDCPHVQAIAAGQPVSEEIMDSNIGIPLSITCSPLYSEDGTLMGSVHVARDISQQKEAADEREGLIRKLEESLARVKQLSGIIPICASCKNIRDDKGYWNQVEKYIKDHSEAEFSHSICPDCVKKLYPDFDSYKDQE